MGLVLHQERAEDAPSIGASADCAPMLGRSTESPTGGWGLGSRWAAAGRCVGGEGSEHIASLGHSTELTGLHLGALDWVPETGSRYFRSVLV